MPNDVILVFATVYQVFEQETNAAGRNVCFALRCRDRPDALLQLSESHYCSFASNSFGIRFPVPRPKWFQLVNL